MSNLIFLFLALNLWGCIHTSRLYEPNSKVEQPFFEQSEKNISFNEVFNNCQSFIDKQIAWTGVIRNVEVNEIKEEKSDGIEVMMTVEHHSFDWVNDTTVQKKFWLSNDTAGNFKAVLIFSNNLKSYNKNNITEAAKTYPGKMFIGYGNPNCFGKKEVFFFPKHFRMISTEEYSIGVPHITQKIRSIP
ncbi:MAG: hypothetical protein ACXVCP_15150 [Bdellovibrio sp.]